MFEMFPHVQHSRRAGCDFCYRTGRSDCTRACAGRRDRKGLGRSANECRKVRRARTCRREKATGEEKKRDVAGSESVILSMGKRAKRSSDAVEGSLLTRMTS